MADLAHDLGHSEHEGLGVENRKLAMWIFLASEFMFFGALISTYLLFKGKEGLTSPVPRELYDIPFTSVSSFVLLMSSLTMVLAHNAQGRKDQPATRSWLLATALLGMVFIGGQVYEFSTFVHEGMTMRTNAAASGFYLLTGFHGTHVLIGIIMLLSLFGISRRHGGLSDANGLNLELVGLYWHFVDIIWIVIFTVVYLIP